MHAYQLTGVEIKSFDPRCHVDSSSVDFDLISNPPQECMNVFCHGGFILCDVFGCKLRMLGLILDAIYRDITAAENKFFLPLCEESRSWPQRHSDHEVFRLR